MKEEIQRTTKKHIVPIVKNKIGRFFCKLFGIKIDRIVNEIIEKDKTGKIITHIKDGVDQQPGVLKLSPEQFPAYQTKCLNDLVVLAKTMHLLLQNIHAQLVEIGYYTSYIPPAEETKQVKVYDHMEKKGCKVNKFVKKKKGK